jgi:hypothetical protein
MSKSFRRADDVAMRAADPLFSLRQRHPKIYPQPQIRVLTRC